MSTATCPEWCTDHSAGESREDERHHTDIDGAILNLTISRHIINPDPYAVTFYATADEGQVSAASLRQLSAAATRAADLLEELQGGGAA